MNDFKLLKTNDSISTFDLYVKGGYSDYSIVGGYGFVVQYKNICDLTGSAPGEIESRQGVKFSTENRLVIMAAIHGLREIIRKLDESALGTENRVSITTDSEYFLKAVTKKKLKKWAENDWKVPDRKGSGLNPVPNQDLWKQFMEFQDILTSNNIPMEIFSARLLWGTESYQVYERANRLAMDATFDMKNYIVDEPFDKGCINYENNDVILCPRC